MITDKMTPQILTHLPDYSPGTRYLIRKIIWDGFTLNMQIVEFRTDNTIVISPFERETAATIFMDAAVNIDVISEALKCRVVRCH